jgi:hypothetical protein
MHYRARIFPALNPFVKLKLSLVFMMPSPTNLGPLGLPPPTGQYACLADIKALLQAHARDNSYAIASDCSTAKKAAWICSKSG